jgi:hypothetical protein
VNQPGRDGWAGAPAIEMLDAAADAGERAADVNRARQARLRAMAAALGMLRAIPRQM